MGAHSCHRAGGDAVRRAGTAARRCAATVGIAAVLLLAGAATDRVLAGVGGAFVAPGAPLAGRPRLALLPLEDLSDKAEAGEILARILFSELARTGVCDVVEPGQVQAAMDELSLRDAGGLSAERARQLSDTLGAPFLMLGSVLESGTVRAPDGDVPTLALALRILDARAGRVIWADMMARTGEDGETLFGWGREYDSSKMAQQMAATMFRSLRELAGPATPPGGKLQRPGDTPPPTAPGAAGGAPADSLDAEPPTGGTP
jgi:hypothetical protein